MKTQAQQGLVSVPKAHSCQVREAEFQPKFQPGSGMGAANPA